MSRRHWDDIKMKIYAHITTTLTVIMALAILTACGGVATNPTSPTFNPPANQGQQTGQETDSGLPGQLSGGGAQMGEQVIQGNFEELWPQGLEALGRGQVVTGAQFFMSAFHQNPQSADAALAYAIADVMRDYRMYAVLMHPGIDKLMMNTPLVGMPEAFPNPFLTEDSYFLRLAAMGNRAHTLNPNVSYPIVAPVDSEAMFNPNTLGALMGGPVTSGTNGGAPPPGMSTVDHGGNTVTNPGGADEPPPAEDPGEGTTPDDSAGRMGIDKLDLPDVKQAGSLGGEGSGGDATDPATTTGGGGFHTGFETPLGEPELLPERDVPLSEDEWDTLIREYRQAAARDGADIFLSSNFYDNLSRFHESIQEHISNLESVRTMVEAEGYALPLSFNVLDGTQIVTLMFDVKDYNLILDHYKMIDLLLSYVGCYSSETEYIIPVAEMEDLDGDDILTPDEYIPEAPFGTLTEEGRENLAGLHPEFTNTLGTLYTHMEPLLMAAQEVQAGDLPKKELFYLSSFQRNYLLIEEWAQLVRDIAEKSSAGTLIKLASGNEVTEVVAVYDALFLNPLEDIRTPLPSFDFETRIVITDEDENWSSDATYGGFFPDGLTVSDIYKSAGRFRAIIYSEEMTKAADFSVNLNGSTGASGEDGIVTIDGVMLNELAGIDFSVMDPSGTEVDTGTVRTIFEIIPLFDITGIKMLYTPMMNNGMDGVTTNTEGAGEAGPGDAGMAGIGHVTTGPADDQSGEGETGDDEAGDDETGDDETGDGDSQEGSDDSGDEEDKEDDGSGEEEKPDETGGEENGGTG